jgi:hypothetical protein
VRSATTSFRMNKGLLTDRGDSGVWFCSRERLIC